MSEFVYESTGGRKVVEKTVSFEELKEEIRKGTKFRIVKIVTKSKTNPYADDGFLWILKQEHFEPRWFREKIIAEDGKEYPPISPEEILELNPEQTVMLPVDSGGKQWVYYKLKNLKFVLQEEGYGYA
jgi:hypothetical protein